MQITNEMIEACKQAKEQNTYYVIEMTHDNFTWTDSYPGLTEESALKLAAFDHSDLLPNLLLVCLGIEH